MPDHRTSIAPATPRPCAARPATARADDPSADVRRPDGGAVGAGSPAYALVWL